MKASRHLTFFLCALAAALTGCSGPDVIVLDSNGKPIADAKIVGASLSIGGQTTFANKRGEAKIPWAIQETKWISIQKDGYQPVEHVDAAQKKPIVVKLTKTNG
jgi:hypothetical protein